MVKIIRAIHENRVKITLTLIEVSVAESPSKAEVRTWNKTKLIIRKFRTDLNRTEQNEATNLHIIEYIFELTVI